MKTETDNDMDKTPVKKEELLERAKSAYEAVVAIAKEARRLNAVPGVYLRGGEKPLPKAVRNFVDGKVTYEVEGAAPEAGRYARKNGKRG